MESACNYIVTYIRKMVVQSETCMEYSLYRGYNDYLQRVLSSQHLQYITNIPNTIFVKMV